MKTLLIHAVVIATLVAASAWGAGGSPELAPAQPVDPDYHNLYVYAVRMGPNPEMNLVYKHYNEALRLDPGHRRAHEYLGEAYLMAGNLEKAKEHLKVLDRLCFFPCEEFSMLKKAVADYEAKQARK